jgi:ribonuclease J
MKLTIHRGSKEIGGSCVELRSGGSRILIDLGLPLVDVSMERFDPRKIKDKSKDDLLRSGLLPPVEGLYEGEPSGFDAVLLSHPHPDHYGLLSFVNPTIPVYMSEGCRHLLGVASYFHQTDYQAKNVRLVQPGVPFTVGRFEVTPYLVDHSAFGALAFMVQSQGTRLFYSGDFRGHGRKSGLFEAITRDPPKDIDCLLLEGTMLGSESRTLRSERAVEEEIVRLIKGSDKLFLVACSSQNIDRLVSVYKACVWSDRILVIDPYTAFILDQLKGISPRLPQYNWGKNIRVFFAPNRHTETMAEDGSLFRFKSAKITYEQMVEAKSQVIIKNSFRVSRTLADRGNLKDAVLIYSMWEGYLANDEDFWRQQSVPIVKIHSSGHASVRHLQAFADALDPKRIVPIHTDRPDLYQKCFGDRAYPLADEVPLDV